MTDESPALGLIPLGDPDAGLCVDGVCHLPPSSGLSDASGLPGASGLPVVAGPSAPAPGAGSARSDRDGTDRRPPSAPPA
jgi:hypothetical protein